LDARRRVTARWPSPANSDWGEARFLAGVNRKVIEWIAMSFRFT
jgi:hypothetical protein